MSQNIVGLQGYTLYIASSWLFIKKRQQQQQIGVYRSTLVWNNWNESTKIETRRTVAVDKPTTKYDQDALAFYYVVWIHIISDMYTKGFIIMRDRYS